MIFKRSKYLFLILLFATFCRKPADILEVEEEPVVNFSDEAGAYSESQKVITLSAPKGHSIYYTEDGSIPTTESQIYSKPIYLTEEGNRWVNKSAVDKMAIKFKRHLINPISVTSELPSANIIRAIAVAPDGTQSKVVTKTYFIGADLRVDYDNIMVVSIATDPENLLDHEKGILATGKIFDEWSNTAEATEVMANNEWWKVVANYTQKGKDWERPISIEFFDNSNSLSHQQDAGLRLKGRASRMFEQKSFNIYFRESYGEKGLSYPVFPGFPVKSFSLRNGGNDAEYLKFKDSWIQSRLRDKAFSTQIGRIAVVFLNGEYWGHYSLEERYDDRYIENHYGVEDHLVIKEGQVEEGQDSDIQLYKDLLLFADKDLSNESEWQAFKKVMDIRSMADYFAAEIYIGNADWKQNVNTELWRSLSVDPSNPYEDGRWRFILYDTEYSSAQYEQEETNVSFDSFSKAMKDHPLFAAAVRNAEFQALFKESILDISDRCFDPEDVEADLKEWEEEWLPYMPDYYKRFEDTSWAWRKYMNLTTSFFGDRAAHILPAVEKGLSEAIQDKEDTAGGAS